MLERRYSFVGRFLGLLGGIGDIFLGLGELLGGLGVVLGWAWAVLGCSWEGLGGVLGGLGTILGQHLEQSNFRLIFCSFLVAKRVPTWRHFENQNGAQIDPKTTSKFKSEHVASWKRLGSIWGRFRRVPGGHFL